MAESLNDILAKIQKSFKIRRSVDFDDIDLHIDMEPLTSVEEVKVIEAVRDFEGAEYLEAMKRFSLAFAIKRINGMTFGEGETVTEEVDGKIVSKSKFLVLREYVAKWPTAFINSLFDSYSNILEEAADYVKKSMKFKEYKMAEPPEPEKEQEAPAGMKVVKESTEPETEAEALQQQVEKEIDQANAAMAETEANAQQ